MKNLGKIFFRYRSYSPLPFVILMILFMKPTLISIIIGLLITFCGEFIRLWAVSYAGSETRTTSGVGGTQLVTQGPFGFVRNPLYIGNITIYFGLGLMSLSLFPYLQIIALTFFIFQYYCIILEEEEYLENTFKDKFISYKKIVNRFIPKKCNLPEDLKSDIKIDIKNGLNSEKRSLQSISIITFLILAFYIYYILKS
jgi:protein-S-isoprenylcysteine O-methyltransferase Ste14